VGGKVRRLYREAYAGIPRQIWLLSYVAFINRSGTMVVPFLTLYLTGPRGLTIGEAGALLALHGAGGILGTYAGGLLSDRVAPRRVQVASLVLSGLGFFVVGALRGTITLAAALILLGVVGEAFRPANATSLSHWAAAGSRTRAFALRRLAVNLGMSFGPAAGGFLALVSYGWLFVVDGATCLLAAVVLWLLLPDEPRAEARRTPRPEETGDSGAGDAGHASDADGADAADEAAARRSPWRDGPYLAFLALLMLTAMIVFQFVGAYPLTLRDLYQMAENRIGLLLAVNTGIIVAFEMVLLHTLRRRHPLRVLALGALLLGSGFALLPLGSTFAFAVLGVVIWTCGEMLTFPVAEGFAAERAGSRSVGRYLGLFATAFGLAFVLAQVVGMGVYQTLGPRGLWLGIGLLGALLAGGYLALARWTASPPAGV
jgi:predicted MFS family arabinose efflux permease